jgi:serine protease Do
MKFLASLLIAAFTSLPAFAADPPSFASTARIIKPSVVNISTEQVIQAQPFGGAQDDPFFFFHRQFNFQMPRQQYTQHSLGSGVIVGADGTILTNNHVVEKASKITVKFADGDELPARVVGTDPRSDLAVIRVKDGRSFAAAKFGDSDAMEVGDWVIAVGSPFGFEQTVSHGILSAKGRVIEGGPYENFFQTDAPINPGNSGGPLVNLAGEVIGINTLINSTSGGSEGIGFAIPSNLAQKVTRELVAHGKVVRGWLGVQIQPLTKSLRKSFGLPSGTQGALIADVLKDGPAAKAGFKQGDIVTRFDGKAVADVTGLQGLVADTAVGRTAEVQVWRDKKFVTLAVKIVEMPKDLGAKGETMEEQESQVKLGISVEPLGQDEARQLGVENGVVVNGVEAGSAAEAAGIQQGDVLLQLDRVPVHDPAQLRRLVNHLKSGQSVVLQVSREGHNLFLSVDIP